MVLFFSHFKGIAKHTFHVWVDAGIIDKAKMKKLDDRMKLLKLPSDIGRIARNMSDCYKNMKADEWKHWTLIYSMFALRGVLPSIDYDIWALFVSACTILCNRSITPKAAADAHNSLKEFCCAFEERYGTDCCVPNMHLSLHIKDCILDYGSVYGFWCFSFERYNGILGKYHSNNHSITLQTMRKLVAYSHFPKEEDQNVEEVEMDHFHQMIGLRSKSGKIEGEDLEFVCEKLASIPRQFLYDADLIEELKKLYQGFYKQYTIRISRFVKTYSRVIFQNETIAIQTYRSSNSPYSQIMAYYPDPESEDDFSFSAMKVRPAIVKSILEITVICDDGVQPKQVKHTVCNCFFYRATKHEDALGASNMVFETLFEEPCFIPVKFITGRFICQKEDILVEVEENVWKKLNFQVVIPLPTKSLS